jgi:ferric-dicitrate binding protein FerR (iron transport regulator)
MTENDFKKLMKKYLKGTISRREESLLEQFDSTLLSKNANNVFHNESHKKRIKQRLSKGIGNQNKETSSLSWVGIAASLALVLSLGYLSYNALNKETKEEPVAEMIKTTDWGQKLNLTLADGTRVHLNSGSTIEFPERFEGNTREVKFEGEAFFDVSKNPHKPFIIKSGEIHTTVLGTSFNISTYPQSQQIAVTVASGKVKITSEDSEVFLGPNEQGVFDKGTKTISKEQTDIAAFLRWKDGILHFDDVTLTEVAKSLEHWYGVTFVFENEKVGGCHLTATYDNEILSAVLESIVHAKKGLQYTYLEDKKILIRGWCTD